MGFEFDHKCIDCPRLPDYSEPDAFILFTFFVSPFHVEFGCFLCEVDALNAWPLQILQSFFVVGTDCVLGKAIFEDKELCAFTVGHIIRRDEHGPNIVVFVVVHCQIILYFTRSHRYEALNIPAVTDIDSSSWPDTSRQLCFLHLPPHYVRVKLINTL